MSDLEPIIKIVEDMRRQWEDHHNADLDKLLALLRSANGKAQDGSAAGSLEAVMLDACSKLPEWWRIDFTVEHLSGSVGLTDPDGNYIDADTFGHDDASLSEQVKAALAFAIETDRSDKAVKPGDGP